MWTSISNVEHAERDRTGILMPQDDYLWLNSILPTLVCTQNLLGMCEECTRTRSDHDAVATARRSVRTKLLTKFVWRHTARLISHDTWRYLSQTSTIIYLYKSVAAILQRFPGWSLMFLMLNGMNEVGSYKHERHVSENWVPRRNAKR